MKETHEQRKTKIAYRRIQKRDNYHYPFTNKIAVYYFMIAHMTLILLQLDFGLNRVLQE
jgi:hypothetical protein